MALIVNMELSIVLHVATIDTGMCDMVSFKKNKQQQGGNAVFVSKLPSMLLKNWEALGFKKLPKYSDIAKETGVNSRTVGKWMEEGEFTKIDGDVIGAFMRYFQRNNVPCDLDDLVAVKLMDSPAVSS